MKIMCLNGWGGRLHDSLLRFVRETSPDLLCLQEVVHTPASRKDWLTYRDGDHLLPQRANFFRDVSQALPGHVATFCPAAQGMLWDDETAVPSQWGLATFVRSDFPIIGQGQAFVHKAFSPHGYGDHPRSRNAHAVRLYDFKRGWSLTVAHMHGLRDLDGKRDTPERLAQARRLVELVDFVSEPNDRVVVCGDFNVEPHSQTFDVLRERGLSDLVTGNDIADTRTSHYKPGRFADYMLVNNHVKFVSFDVVAEPEVSDHRPLILEL